MNYGTWNKEHIARLVALFEEGLTITEMAVAMDRTRGAIAGRLHRLGLRITKEKKLGRDIVEGDVARMLRRAKRRRMRVHGRTVSLMELGPDTCRWPLWEDYGPCGDEYCGRQISEGSVYCDDHRTVNVRGTKAVQLSSQSQKLSKEFSL